MFTDSILAIRNATALMDRGVRKINRDEYVEGFIEMNEAVRMAKAGVIAIHTEDKMYETLLDIYA
ncbi:MAG: hypothetical protein KAR42_10115 [candidate division Zixibacteria bacterium]|nr:hypothetical protein [candidate division Zixibacteria bacterium]